MIRRPDAPLLRRRPLAAVLLVCVALVAVWRVADAVSAARWSSRVERVARASGDGVAGSRALPFRFRARTWFLTVRVSAAELRAAEAVETDEVFSQPPARRIASLRTLVRAESRADCVSQAAGRLRAIRDELHLDDDAYVELMAAAVQEIPYGTPRTAFQLPAATLVSGEGVCIDRSLLLAGLLLHEGYDAGLWLLPGRNHVAVAVRCEGRGYRGSGYVFVESTERRSVGEVPERYSDTGGPEPLLVRGGSGRSYRAGPSRAGRTHVPRRHPM